MRTLEYAIGGMFGLILVYLIVVNGKNSTEVLDATGKFLTNQTKALQGR